MIFIIYDSKYNAYKFIYNSQGVFRGINKYELIGVIDNGTRKDLQTIKKLFNSPDGWVANKPEVKRFISDKKVDIPISLAIYSTKFCIGFMDKNKLKKRMSVPAELFDAEPKYIEYKIPFDKITKIIKQLAQSRIKGSICELNEKSKQILTEMEQYKIS